MKQKRIIKSANPNAIRVRENMEASFGGYRFNISTPRQKRWFPESTEWFERFGDLDRFLQTQVGLETIGDFAIRPDQYVALDQPRKFNDTVLHGQGIRALRPNRILPVD